MELLGATSTTSLNAEKFLVGMSSLKLEENREILRKKAISFCCVDDKNAAFVGRMISADASLLNGLAAKDHVRVCKLLVEHAKASKVGLTSKFTHPAKQMGSMAATLLEEDIVGQYEEFFAEILKRYPYEPVFFKALEGKAKLTGRLVKLWKKNAGSSSFDAANRFASSIQEIDLGVGSILNDKDAFEIVVAVKQAADWNAFDSKSLVSSKFSDAPKLAEAAERYVVDHKSLAGSFVVDKSVADNLEDFLATVLHE